MDNPLTIGTLALYYIDKLAENQHVKAFQDAAKAVKRLPSPPRGGFRLPSPGFALGLQCLVLVAAASWA